MKNTNICSDAPPSPGTLHYRMVLQFARVMRSVTLTTLCTVSRTTATASTVTPPAEPACQVGQLTVGLWVIFKELFSSGCAGSQNCPFGLDCSSDHLCVSTSTQNN